MGQEDILFQLHHMRRAMCKPSRHREVLLVVRARSYWSHSEDVKVHRDATTARFTILAAVLQRS